MEMTSDRWAATAAYMGEVFGGEDEHLAGLMDRAERAGLPRIAVSTPVGRLLKLLAGMSGGGAGARRALELGALAGYSGIWIARGLGEGGRLITLEPDAVHADFAERSFEEAGVADRVELRRSEGLDELARLVEEFGEGSFDFVFVDAIKVEYPEYFPWCARLLCVGGVLAVDNVLGGGTWWVGESETEAGERSRVAVDRFNRMVAGDSRFESTVVPLREGVLVARKVGE